MNVAKSLRSGRPPRRAPHATHFASHLCPSAHFPRRRSTSTDPMPLEAADASSPLQVVAGHPGTAPFEGLLWDSNHPHAARRPASRPVASLSAKGAPLRGQQSFWRVRQPSRDFPVSRSEPVPTGASHYTRRLCSSAQRAPQRLWVVKNGYVPRPPRIETPRGPPDTTYGAARVAGPGRGITHPFGATHRAPWAPAWARLGFKGYRRHLSEQYSTPIRTAE